MFPACKVKFSAELCDSGHNLYSHFRFRFLATRWLSLRYLKFCDVSTLLPDLPGKIVVACSQYVTWFISSLHSTVQKHSNYLNSFPAKARRSRQTAGQPLGWTGTGVAACRALGMAKGCISTAMVSASAKHSLEHAANPSAMQPSVQFTNSTQGFTSVELTWKTHLAESTESISKEKMVRMILQHYSSISQGRNCPPTCLWRSCCEKAMNKKESILSVATPYGLLHMDAVFYGNNRSHKFGHETKECLFLLENRNYNNRQWILCPPDNMII